MYKRNPYVMVPGPTPVARSIQDAMGRETVSFHDPRLVAEFKALIDDLTTLWRCDGIAFVVAGSGTMAMEMGIVNIASDEDRVLVCSNGYFGDRYIDICSRRGFKMDTIRAKWGETVTADEIDRRLSEDRFDVLVLTHVETSTGVEFPLRDLTRMMRDKHPEVLIAVDGVASMGGVEFYMDWGVDVMLTCSQKCFGISPGLGILWAGRRAIEKRRGMPPLNASYVDFEKWIPVMKDTVKYWGTPAVNLIWALSESVRIIKEEGLENRFKRHRHYAKAIRGSLSAMGFAPCCASELASPTVTVGLYPDGSGIDDAAFRGAVYDEGAHIAGCFGDFAGKGFRVGHMGNIEPNILVSAVAAIERAAIRCGHKIEPGVGLAALQRTLLEG
ncbi:MAG: alanine--glyoxylate aminotransferase family protein [Synergistaceae bacterium]|jgi:aspartate aminotransferase-like enzyme|nr:alanine--glyoxylate aminotransferase family protein [Synergistaceae bacterium]